MSGEAEFLILPIGAVLVGAVVVPVLAVGGAFYGAYKLGEGTAQVGGLAADLAVVGLGMAAFSAPNTSAIMGSVRRDQLSVSSAFLGTMRSAGMALSVALLGGIAASQMGRLGGRLLFTHGHGAPAAGLAAQAASGFAQGYRYAMLTGAEIFVDLGRQRGPDSRRATVLQELTHALTGSRGTLVAWT